MRPLLWERFMQLLCRFLGHVPGDTWEHQGTNTACQRCRILYKCRGFYMLRTFRDAAASCGQGESIYRSANVYVKYAKNHPVPLSKRVPFLDRMSRDWVIFDPNEA